LSFVPLFATPEKVQTKQHITLTGFDYKTHIQDYASWASALVENHISITIWPLFVAVFIFKGNPYAKLGVLASASTLLALLVSRFIGRLIDDSKGLAAFRVGIVLNSLVHLVRPLAHSLGLVVAINAVNEPATALFRMPYMKGMYDSADSLPGYRIVYLATMEAVALLAASLFWAALWLLSVFYDPKTLMQGAFVLAAVLSLLVGTEKFQALRSH
jgi:hypothetical protein